MNRWILKWVRILIMANLSLPPSNLQEPIYQSWFIRFHITVLTSLFFWSARCRFGSCFRAWTVPIPILTFLNSVKCCLSLLFLMCYMNRRIWKWVRILIMGVDDNYNTNTSSFICAIEFVIWGLNNLLLFSLPCFLAY